VRGDNFPGEKNRDFILFREIKGRRNSARFSFTVFGEFEPISMRAA